MLKLAATQALAHGAMGVNYFQWRQSRGGEEKFHGAVVAHRAGEEGRTFREVQEVGGLLAELPDIASARVPAQVGLIYDFENEWVLNQAYLPRKVFKEYQGVCVEHYAFFWQAGIPVDLLGAQGPLDGYTLVIAPMMHLLSEATAQRLADYVAAGGTLITTYLTEGWAIGSCPSGNYPIPPDVLGLKMVEFDTFGPENTSRSLRRRGIAGAGRRGFAGRYAELLQPVTAEPSQFMTVSSTGVLPR
jgi:beta-galactosidase